MIDMAVTIDLERFISIDDLEDNVIRQLAETCESKLSGGHTDSFHAMCVAAIEKAISERVEARIADLIDKPIVPRNRFGDAIEGMEAKSLGDMLAEAVEIACTQTVNREGKPAKNTTYEKAVPRIQWHLSNLVSSEIDREAASAIKELKAEAKQKVRDQIAAAVAAQLARA